MKSNMQVFWLTGWLIPAGLALVYFGRWMIDIVIPTLKGGNFDQLYDLHRVRYLNITVAFILIAFIWVTALVLQWARRYSRSH